MITLYQCSFCGEQFPDKESCLEYERAFPVEPHKYKVGEEVLLVPKYPDDEKRFFEKRVIVALLWSSYDEKYKDVAHDIHKPVYELNMTVQTGKALYEGSSTYFIDHVGYYYQPADEESLYRIGDMFSFWTGEGEGRITRPITLNDINPDDI